MTVGERERAMLQGTRVHGRRTDSEGPVAPEKAQQTEGAKGVPHLLGRLSSLAGFFRTFPQYARQFLNIESPGLLKAGFKHSARWAHPVAALFVFATDVVKPILPHCTVWVFVAALAALGCLLAMIRLRKIAIEIGAGVLTFFVMTALLSVGVIGLQSIVGGEKEGAFAKLSPAIGELQKRLGLVETKLGEIQQQQQREAGRAEARHAEEMAKLKTLEQLANSFPQKSNPVNTLPPVESAYPGLPKELVTALLSQSSVRYLAHRDQLLSEAEATSQRLTPQGRASLHRLRALYDFGSPSADAPQKALKELHEAAKLAPDDPHVFADLSLGYSLTGNDTEALRYVEMANDKARNHPDLAAWTDTLQCRFADIYYSRGDIPRAQDALRFCLDAPTMRTFPFLGIFWAEKLGDTLNAQGRYSEAEQLLTKAVATITDVPASTAEVIGFTELGLKRYDLAEHWLSKALYDYSERYVSTLSSTRWLEDYTRGNANMILLYLTQGRTDALPKYLHRIEVALGRAVPQQCLPLTSAVLLRSAFIAVSHQEQILFGKLLSFAKTASGDPPKCLPPPYLGVFLTVLLHECGNNACIEKRATDALSAFDKVPYLSANEVQVRDIAKQWLEHIKRETSTVDSAGMRKFGR